jgi:DNA-directed RNA polymerase subunit RPC12/RpoP
MRSAENPIPNQGVTFGDPSRIECPTCGKTNDVTGDPIDEGDAFDCDHCGSRYVVEGVDYSVTITVRAPK